MRVITAPLARGRGIGHEAWMLRLGLAAAFACALLRLAHADEPEGPPRPPIDIIRELYAAGDYEGVKRELLKQYALVPDPQLLFALGQVELQLGNYKVAIEYYEKFIATSPSDEQIALAQQAIGAARIKLEQPPPKEPEPAPVERHPPRRWKTEDTGLVALGGAAMLVGGGLLYYSHRLGNDHAGALSDYDARLELARTTRWTGIGVGAAGALVVGVTVLRWRLRPDGGELTASLSPTSVTVSARW